MAPNIDPLNVEDARKIRRLMSSPLRASLWQHMSLKRPVAAAQLFQRFIKSRLGPGRLSAGEFIKFGLADAGVSPDQIQRFAGIRVQNAMHAACNDPGWFALSKNKLLWQTYMKTSGLPVPETLAVYDKKGRGAGVPIMTTQKQLTRYLADSADIALFCKPITGVYSIGTLLLDRADKKSIRVNGGDRQPLSRVAAFIDGVAAKGYLFQRPIVMHPSFEGMGLSALPTLRFLVLLTPNGAEIASVALKLGGKGEIADNFWRPGARICAIDDATGGVIRVVGSDQSANGLTGHTDNLTGFVVPDYDIARSLVCEASGYYSGVTTQSWDVAHGRDGPLLLELNHGGDLSLGQLAHGAGVLTPQYCEHLRHHKYTGALPS